MNRDEFRKLLKDKCGFNENYDKKNNFERKYKGLSLHVTILTENTIWIRFYSGVNLNNVESINGPWLAQKLFRFFDQKANTSITVRPRQKPGEGQQIYDEGSVAEVKFDKPLGEAGTQEMEEFARQLKDFLNTFSSIKDAKKEREAYYHSHVDFINRYAQRRKNTYNGLTEEEVRQERIIDVAPTESHKCWWLAVDKGRWSLSSAKINEEIPFETFKNQANKKVPLKIRDAFKSIKQRDWILGFEDGSAVCICEVTKESTDDYIYFKKIVDFKTPVSRSDSWPKKVPWRGITLKELPIEQWNVFMQQIKDKNGDIELDDRLKEVESSDSQAQVSNAKDPRNWIFFGAPGTGKSFTVDEKVANDDTAIRTTFHPDSDYASFVGAYKPTMNGDKIAYEFVPQAFTKAYVQAWEKMAQAEDGKAAVPQYLVIEEINRGNCAQIFGDLFQLLDRDDEGYSKYPIYPDADIKKHLYDWFHGKYTDEDGKKSQVNDADGAKWREKKASANSDSKATWADILSGSKLVLPPNLYIWATMNTSDQSLFPMDSAFKRRWEWKYSKIKNEKKDYKIKVAGQEFDWWDFLEKINAVIRDVTSSADKQLGYFFIKLPENETTITAKTFVNKVIFYLWNDVFRDCELDADAFMVHNKDEKDSENNTNSKRQLTFDDFFDDNGEVKDVVVRGFLEKLLKKNTENNGAGETSPNQGEVPVSGSVSPGATTPEQ